MRRSIGWWVGWAALACLASVGCSDDQAAPPPGGGAGSAGTLAAGSGGTPGAGAGGSVAGSTAAGSGGSTAGSTAAGSGGRAAAGSGGRAAAGSGGSQAAGSGGSSSSPGQSLKAKIVAKSVPPDGQEHVCVVLDLGNAAPVWVNRATAVLTGGSHHLIVDRRPASAQLMTAPTVCAPTMASDDSRLMIAQQARTTVQLPPGVAFKLDARQRVFLQLHYFNASAMARDISGEVELVLTDPEAGTPMEAQTLFTGATQIMLAARSDGEVKSFFSPDPSEAKRRYFALTSHTHRLGVHATIERVASMNAPAATPLHESRDWSEPPLTLLDPPLAFTGSDGLRLICRYHNDTDQTVHFGVEAQDEMCFMWLYFYDQR